MTANGVSEPTGAPPPEMVFKYLHPERVGVLTDRRIRFTQASALNDPFELRPYFDAILNDGEVERMVATVEPDWEYGAKELDKHLPPELRGKIALSDILALLKSTGAYEGVIDQVRKEMLPQMRELVASTTPLIRDMMVDKLRNNIGILSLSADSTNPLMWSHYSEKHTGFVVGFRTGDPWFHRERGPNDEFFRLRQVEYVDGGWARPRLEDLGSNVLVRKLGQWRYEQEWRMLAPVSMASALVPAGEENVALFNYPESCVAKVIIGATASPHLAEQVRKAVDSWPSNTRPLVQHALLDSRAGSVVIIDGANGT